VRVDDELAGSATRRHAHRQGKTWGREEERIEACSHWVHGVFVASSEKTRGTAEVYKMVSVVATSLARRGSWSSPLPGPFPALRSSAPSLRCSDEGKAHPSSGLPPLLHLSLHFSSFSPSVVEQRKGAKPQLSLGLQEGLGPRGIGARSRLGKGKKGGRRYY
jgi:hypothetical protein